jgi:hypothetical protein
LFVTTSLKKYTRRDVEDEMKQSARTPFEMKTTEQVKTCNKKNTDNIKQVK